MSLEVVDIQLTDRNGKVTVQGATQQEVSSREAKDLVLKTAAQRGLARAGLSGGESIYPVDAEGKTTDELILGRGTVVGYRGEYPVTGGL